MVMRIQDGPFHSPLPGLHVAPDFTSNNQRRGVHFWDNYTPRRGRELKCISFLLIF